MKEAVLILHDIRSEQNVGSLFRTADAAGISQMYLTGYTPTPVDRFGRPAKGIAKAALGAEALPYESRKMLPPLLKKLKTEGFQIIAIEQSKNSLDYKKIRIGKKAAFILGNEVTGLSSAILKLCDAVTEIPMKGKKESLNVAVAGGVALFRILGI